MLSVLELQMQHHAFRKAPTCCMKGCVVCFAACTLLSLLTQCLSQGLDYNREAVLGASNAQSRLEAVYKNAKAWRASYRNAISTCSRNQGSLCAASGLSNEQKAQLLMATSPQAFDARSSSQMGGFSAVGQVKDQGDCNTCVSFVVLGAAQSAVACALKSDATSTLSEQDFFFCKSVQPKEERTCSSTWNMDSGIQAWVNLDGQDKYPTTEYCMPYNPSNTKCDYNCKDTDQDLTKGHFTYISRMQNIWQVQEHIRNWGSVVTRLDVYDSFRPFFQKDPGGIYPGPGPGAKVVENHAIQLVGYNMDSTPQYWIAKNSWGTGFAAGGFFKVALGKAGVCSPEDTFGLKFILTTPPSKPYSRLSPSFNRKGCYDYRAQPYDYISKVATTFDLSIQQVLFDNKEVVPEPDMYLGGISIVLCGLYVPGGAAAPPAAAEPAAPPPVVKPPAAAPPPTPPAAPPPKQSTEQKKQQQQQKPQQQQQKPEQQQPQLPQQQQQQPQQQNAQNQQVDTSGGASSSGQDQQSYTLYYLTIGTYKGSVKCDDKQGTATAALQRDDTRNVGQVLMTSTYVLNGQCTYKMILACNSVRDGTGTWCTGDEEPWLCVVEQTPQWDPCGGQAPEKASSLQMCYSSNSLLLKSLSPTCNSESGTLSLQ